jgi:RHS repeat-associated protein
VAQYAYEPFGNTTVTSGSSTNPYEYTGRENDGTGLYYYRARYYSPSTMRFLSEDPSGFGAGPNFYAYTGDDPIDFVDPLGLKQGGCFDLVSVNCSKSTPPPKPPPQPQAPQSPRCSLSVGQRVSVGIQGLLNTGIGSYKATKGGVDALAGLGFAPETGGASLTATLAGSYELTSGVGQGVTGFSQLRRAVTGNGGPETKHEQYAAIASGPLSGMLVLGSGFSTADAERAANFESVFTAGTGLINSSTASGLIQATVDAGLTAMGIANSGGCK